MDLWSTGEDTVRIAAFLAIRRLTSGTDESIVNLVLKVRLVFAASRYRGDAGMFSEHILDVSAVMQDHYGALSSIHQPDEKFCLGGVHYASCCRLPACFWLHPTAGHPSTEQYENEEQGLFSPFCSRRDFIYLPYDAAGSVQASVQLAIRPLR